MMIKVTMKIDGMSCGMCEAHINDAIRKVFSVKKVASSHRKGITELLIQDPVDTQLLKHAVEECGTRCWIFVVNLTKNKVFPCLKENK